MLYLILAIVSSASMAIVLKIFRTQRGNRYGIILGNYLTCILLAWLLLPDRASVFRADGVTLICSAVGGFCFVGGLVLMQSSIRENGATLTAAFAKLGLIVPLLLSTVFLGERPKPLQLAGMALVFAAILLINSAPDGAASPEAPRAGAPVLLLLTLACCGSGDALAKLFEHIGERSQDGLYFFWLFVTAAVLTVILAILEHRRTGKTFVAAEFAAGIAVGIPNYFASTLLLASLVRLPAVLVYPCFSTGTILLVAAVSAFFFGERPGKRQRAGLALILAALLLLNL